jgi:iron complex outermembrane receptor protein
MTMAPNTYRQRLLVAAACGLVAITVAPARAADAPTAAGLTATVAQASAPVENVVVKAAKRLLKEKNSPSAVTELGAAQISAAGVAGSASSLLSQAPSVFVYQQGLGDNAPELTIRGLRGLEIATTLDGVPTQDLEAPGSFYLANNIGGVVTTNQIGGVSVYPGVAYPDKNTFGTIGGTVAYESKRPTNDQYFDVIGSAGSYGTYSEGFEYNSGAIDSPLGTGDNAAKILLNYKNFQTQGFIDGTANRENEMEFAFDKPYADGLSKFQVTAIYNTASGLIENEPVPLPYLTKYGQFSNYPTNLDFARQVNDYATLIVKDEHYVNDYLTVSGTAFYLHNDNQLETYGANSILLPSSAINAGQGQLTVNGSAPFVNNDGGFGYGGYFGPPMPPPFGIYGGGYGGYFYGPGNPYNPAQYYNNPKVCPAATVAAWGGAQYTPCGINAYLSGGSNDTYGIRPSALITPPDFFGISQAIKIGGLAAKESSPTGYAYYGGEPSVPQDAANAAFFPGGGSQRTIYQGYAQDKIDLLDNTLHITPGATLEGTKSSEKAAYAFCASSTEACAANTPAYGPNGAFGSNPNGTNIDKWEPNYKGVKWDRDFLPFLNISYDFDKILPVAKGLSVYASTANSSLFAPLGDFGPNSAGTPPFASQVHLYEGGVKYNVSNIVFTADYFYQKVDRDFGFFSYQSGPLTGESQYSDYGQREFKGQEAAVTWQVTPEWQLFGNASHLLAKYLTSGFALDTVAEDQYGIEQKGSPVSGVPSWLANFGVDYDHKSTLVDNDNLDVRVSGRYTGHQYDTFDYGGNAYLTVPNFPGLEPLNYLGCPGYQGGTTTGPCSAYTRYQQVTGATVTDTHDKGISPFVIFNLDATYVLPTPQLPVIKQLTFNANVQNLFNHFYYQYFYRQETPGSCGTFKSGPFTGLAVNNYACGPEFADAIPGAPLTVFFTVKARF